MGKWEEVVVVVLVGVLVLSQNGIGIGIALAQPTEQFRAGYACWGGCYNECILESGKNPAQRLPCYFGCLGNCIARPASESDSQYYCQLGCSLDKCVRSTSHASDERIQERCLDNCSNNICNINT